MLKCKFCGTEHVWKKELCPAFNKTCSNCGKLNHFRKQCSNRLNIVNKYNTKHNLINDVTVYHFSNLLKTVNWNFLKTNNSETSWNLFNDFFIHKFNMYFPIYENRKYKKKIIPWNTKEIKKKCRI